PCDPSTLKFFTRETLPPEGWYHTSKAPAFSVTPSQTAFVPRGEVMLKSQRPTKGLLAFCPKTGATNRTARISGTFRFMRSSEAVKLQCATVKKAGQEARPTAWPALRGAGLLACLLGVSGQIRPALRLDRIVGNYFLVLRIPVQHTPFAIGLHRHRDGDLDVVAGFDVQNRLLARAHA